MFTAKSFFTADIADDVNISLIHQILMGFKPNFEQIMLVFQLEMSLLVSGCIP